MDTLLQFYWDETKPSEKLRKRWGQLAGAMHRLRYVSDELGAVTGCSDINDLLERLQYHAENYLIRAYELRERVVGLAASICAESKVAGKLKSKEKRKEALQKIGATAPSLVEPLERLLSAIEHDIELRTPHTHHTFLALGLWTGSDIYDPQDALIDLQGKPDEHAWLEDFLKKEAKRLAEEYHGKATEVINATMALLDGCGKAISAMQGENFGFRGSGGTGKRLHKNRVRSTTKSYQNASDSLERRSPCWVAHRPPGPLYRKVERSTPKGKFPIFLYFYISGFSLPSGFKGWKPLKVPRFCGA